MSNATVVLNSVDTQSKMSILLNYETYHKSPTDPTIKIEIRTFNLTKSSFIYSEIIK